MSLSRQLLLRKNFFFYLPYSLQIYVLSRKNTWPWLNLPCFLSCPDSRPHIAFFEASPWLDLVRKAEQDCSARGGRERGGCKSLAYCSCRLPAQRLLISANWHSWWQAWVWCREQGGKDAVGFAYKCAAPGPRFSHLNTKFHCANVHLHVHQNRLTVFTSHFSFMSLEKCAFVRISCDCMLWAKRLGMTLPRLKLGVWWYKPVTAPFKVVHYNNI